MNKANTSYKETSCLDLNTKVSDSDVHTSVFDKRNDFGFLIANFPWVSGNVPRLPSHDVYIYQLFRFARCCISGQDFHFKNLQITSKLLTQGYRYHTNVKRMICTRLKKGQAPDLSIMAGSY